MKKQQGEGKVKVKAGMTNDNGGGPGALQFARKRSTYCTFLTYDMFCHDLVARLRTPDEAHLMYPLT